MRTCVITGSNRGIGLELCRQLVARGDRVFAACRSPSAELGALAVQVVDGVDLADENVGDRIRPLARVGFVTS